MPPAVAHGNLERVSGLNAGVISTTRSRSCPTRANYRSGVTGISAADSLTWGWVQAAAGRGVAAYYFAAALTGVNNRS